jgi:integrase/recombinase XerD
MALPAVNIKNIKYQGKTHLALYFEYDNNLKNLINTIAGTKWSWEKNCWHIEYSPENLDRLQEILKGNANVEIDLATNLLLPAANENDRKVIHEFRKWMEHKRYSPSTINTYCGILMTFIRFVKPNGVHEAGNDDVVRFTNEYILANHLSSSYQNQAVNAIKLFFRKIMKSEIETTKIERPWREHKLPNVLSKEEIKAILQAPGNLKHRAMLSLIYACGLRRSELLNLKPADVDSRRGLLIIRNAKGRKDRVAPVSEKIILLLREY